MDANKPHRARPRSSIASGAESPRSIDDLGRMARRAQRKVQRELQERPEVVLAAVAGASFIAGAAVGSRLGRLLLAALVPLGLQHVVATRLAPRLAAYVEQLMHDQVHVNGATTRASHVS
jgi:hypothetical protein